MLMNDGTMIENNLGTMVINDGEDDSTMKSKTNNKLQTQNIIVPSCSFNVLFRKLTYQVTGLNCIGAMRKESTKRVSLPCYSYGHKINHSLFLLLRC